MKIAIFCILVALAILPAYTARINNESINLIKNTADLFVYFQNWKNHFNKVYATQGAEVLAFKNFQETLVRIEKKKQQSSNPSVFGLTKYSDLSPVEFKRLLGYVNTTKSSKDVFAKGPLKAPATYDWRNQDRVTPVKDQGQCGSCWAFSVTENVESIYMIANSVGSGSMPALSPQEIVDCDSSDSGCNGGDPPTAYAYIIGAGGLETDSDYPYTAQDGNCAFDKSKVKVSINNWKYATQSTSESEMQDAMVNVGPLSICVDASSWQDYSGGVFMASDCTTNLDHCVQAVGWDTTASTPFWIVRNSWGGDWGESGYIRLQYGQDTCGLATEATSSCINC